MVRSQTKSVTFVFPKDCKVMVEICITFEIRLGENLGREVRQFTLLAGFCTSQP